MPRKQRIEDKSYTRILLDCVHCYQDSVDALAKAEEKVLSVIPKADNAVCVCHVRMGGHSVTLVL